jgi:hypothetical protein
MLNHLSQLFKSPGIEAIVPAQFNFIFKPEFRFTISVTDMNMSGF